MPIFNLRELAYPRVAAALYKNALLSLFFVQDGFPYKKCRGHGRTPTSEETDQTQRSCWKGSGRGGYMETVNHH